MGKGALPDTRRTSSQLIFSMLSSNIPNDIYRYLIFSSLTDFDLLVFRCTCRYARNLVLKLHPDLLEKCKFKLYESALCSVQLLDWLLLNQRIRVPFRGSHQQQFATIAAAGNYKDSILWFEKNQKHCIGHLDPALLLPAGMLPHIKYFPYECNFSC